MPQQESRVKKSLLNARVNLIFYFLTLVLSFFSRKIFLDTLGADFVGLTGTLQNLLGFLNLAELGISTAIGYVLYKPLFDHDEEKITEIISVFGYLYRWIGFVILGAGLVLACFLPLIFPNTQFEMGIIFFAYFSFLASSLIGYFANYKQTLLGADQKNYVVTAYFQTATIIKTLIQMASAYYTGSYYLWVAIELIFGIIYSFILNWKINQVYPWLRSSIKAGKRFFPYNKIIINKAKQLFVHLLASVGRTQFLPLLIYAFASLTTVAYYGNYMIIVNKISSLVNNLLGSTSAGVGNLISENNTNKIFRVYWELNAMRFLIAGIIVFSIYYLIDPFIALWLGSKYLLDKEVLIVIACNLFIYLVRGTNEQFIYGYGLFYDIWAPIVTLLITIITSLILGYYYGLVGVLLGDLASSLTIICIWKPYFLFSKGFKVSIWIYWRKIIKYMTILLIVWIFSGIIIRFLICPLMNIDSFSIWVVFSLLVVSIFSILYLIGLFLFDSGTMRNLFVRLRNR